MSTPNENKPRQYETGFFEHFYALFSSKTAEIIQLRKLANKLGFVKPDYPNDDDLESKEYYNEILKSQKYILYGFHYGLLQINKDNTFTLNVNGQTVQMDSLESLLYSSPMDTTNEHLSSLINTITYLQLAWYQKLHIKCKVLAISFYQNVIVNALISSILIASLLFLQASWLSFTPVNTILLAFVLVLSSLIMSILNYINLTKMTFNSEMDPDGYKDPEGLFSAIWSIGKALWNHGLKSRTFTNIILATCLYGSGIFFMAATLNKCLYSLFLASSAVSLLPFATTPYACFAFFMVCAAITYSLNPHHFNNLHVSAQSDGKFELYGVTVDRHSFLGIIGKTIYDGITTTSQLTRPAVTESIKQLREDSELQVKIRQLSAPTTSATLENIAPVPTGSDRTAVAELPSRTQNYWPQFFFGYRK